MAMLSLLVFWTTEKPVLSCRVGDDVEVVFRLSGGYDRVQDPVGAHKCDEMGSGRGLGSGIRKDTEGGRCGPPRCALGCIRRRVARPMYSPTIISPPPEPPRLGC